MKLDTQLAFLALALAIGGCAVLGGSEFPSLEPVLTVPDGYALVKQEGPDFDVWRVEQVEPAEPGATHGLGFYIGLWPQDIEGVPPVRRVRGEAAGQTVTWHEWAEDGELRRQTQFKLRPSLKTFAVTVDLWVWARTEKELEAMTGLARRLRFRERRGAA